MIPQYIEEVKFSLVLDDQKVNTKQPLDPCNTARPLMDVKSPELFEYLPVVKKKVTVVIPVKNEASGIGLVIDEVLKEGYSKILVVDGYSTDKTLQIAAAKNGVKIIQQHGRGKTGAIETAIENVSTPYMLILDGDYTYRAKDIQRLMNHCNNYAQIIGARDRKKMSLTHRFGNWVITKSFNILMGTHLSDVCSGMYLLRTDVARGIEFGSRSFSTEVEIASQIAADYEITEVPIGYRRRKGKAKLSWHHGFEILSSLVGLVRKYNTILLFSAFSLLAVIPAAAILSWVAFSEFASHVWHSGWALMGVMLLLFASQAFAVGTMVLLLKRTENRIIQRFQRVR
jgi:dolichol-phosphate mannosyltransferase